MTEPAFVDTNILVYAEDTRAGAKHAVARALIFELWESRTGCISIQVLQELFVTLTRKLKRPLSQADARLIVEEYLAWRTIANTPALFRRALDLAEDYSVSFGDAAILAAANASGARIVYSEDLSDGQTYGEVTVVNPFRRRA